MLVAAFAVWRANLPAQSTTSDDASFRRVSNRLLCQCGCGYMVLSCNHIDCPSATHIRRTIQLSLRGGQTEDVIVASFVEQYGPKILPEPPRQGFSWMAWLMPFIGLLLGGGAVSLVLLSWKKRIAPAHAAPRPSSDILETAAAPVSPEVVEKYRAQIDQQLDKE